MSEPYWVALGSKIPIDYIGGWSAGVSYKAGDVVSYNGVDYIAVNPSTGSTPPPLSGLLVVGIGTSLPVSPVNDQEYILVDSLTAPTYQWRFRYLAAKAINKWLFIGGSRAYAEVQTAETTTSNPYVALATPGPSLIVPIAGDYIVEHGFISTTAKPNYMSYDIGATPAVDADRVETALAGVIDGSGTASRIRRKSLGAVTLTAKYGSFGGQSSGFKSRWIAITPVAVGG